MQGQLFQLLDSDNDNVGLIWTDAEGDRPEFEKDFEEYYNDDENDDPGADEFVDFMNQKYPQFTFERVYVTEIKN